MSLKIIKKNSSSPFLLQRSMVYQGGEGGAYEQGGYDPDNTYQSSGIASSLSSMASLISDVISSRTSEDKNNSDIKQEERLKIKSKKLTDKLIAAGGEKDNLKADRIAKRIGGVQSRLSSTSERIKKYNEYTKPTTLNKEKLLNHKKTNQNGKKKD